MPKWHLQTEVLYKAAKLYTNRTEKMLKGLDFILDNYLNSLFCVSSLEFVLSSGQK